VSVVAENIPVIPAPSVVTLPSSSGSSLGLVNESDDIGFYIGGKRPDDFTLHKILTSEQATLDDNTLPFSIHMKQGKQEKRFLKQSHLKKFKSWLLFSSLKQGLFCKYCAFFVPNGTLRGNPLKKLVTEPANNYARLLGADGSLETHQKNNYHIEATLAGHDFIKTYENPRLEVSNILESKKLAELEEKKVMVKKLIECVIFLGRQNIAFRGHRDSGKLKLEAPDHNEGNFRSLLRFRARFGDEVLKTKITESKLKYVGPMYQNEFINLCGQEIQENIKKRVQAAKYFSIIFDESPDISRISQMSLVLRYVDFTGDRPKAKVREDFIMFIDARQAAYDILNPLMLATETEPETDKHNNNFDNEDEAYLDDDLRAEPEEEQPCRRPIEPVLSGVVVGKIAINAVEVGLGLDMNNCVAVATDSCAVMMSEAKGAVAEILKVAKHAVKTPCDSHSLNNSLSQSSNVQLVKNSSAIIQRTSTFLNSSSKRNFVVRDIMKKGGMPKLCETRFIERHSAYLIFRDSLPLVIEVLTEIMGWNEAKTSADANSLILSITDPGFIITLVCMCDVFALTLPLAALLQKESLDVASASEHINDIIDSLEEKRRNADENFSVLFSEAVEILEKLGGEMKVPPQVFRRGRAGHPGNDDPETYFRQVSEIKNKHFTKVLVFKLFNKYCTFTFFFS